MIKYQRPLCEAEKYTITQVLLQGSDLTDDGAGDSLIPGTDYTF